MEKRILLQPRRERHRPIAPLWLPFSRWLGRELNAPERKIVYALENQRRREGGIRALVTDKSRFDSRPILKRYAEWLIAIRYPAGAVVVIAPTRRQAAAESLGMTVKPLLGYPTRPDGLRGRNYDVALYLDAHGYVFSSRLMLAVTGTVSDSGVVIVHTRKGNLRPTPRYAESTLYDPPPPDPSPPPTADEVEVTIYPLAEEAFHFTLHYSFFTKEILLFYPPAVAVTAPEGKTAKRTLTCCKDPPLIYFI